MTGGRASPATPTASTQPRTTSPDPAPPPVRPGCVVPCSRTTTPTGTSTTSCTTRTPTPATPPTPRPAPPEVAKRGRQGRLESHQETATPTREEHHAAGPTHHPLPAHLGDPAYRGHG